MRCAQDEEHIQNPRIDEINGFEMAEEINELLTEIMPPFQVEEAQQLARECVKNNYKGC